MRYFRLSLQFTLFITLFLFIACASTKFPTLWKDETFQRRPEKVLVINTFPNPASRRLFEDEFVKALKDRRVDAVVSYNVMPDPVVDDKEAIAGQANSVGADSVLINRPIGATTHENTAIYGVTYGDLYVNTQTNFYDMKLNRVVLSTTAETVIPQGESYPSHIQSYVIDLVNKLSQAGLF